MMLIWYEESAPEHSSRAAGGAGITDRISSATCFVLRPDTLTV